MSAKNRLRIHNLSSQNRPSKTKSPELNTHEAFLCLTQSILVTRAQPHIPEICLSTLSVNHTIDDFRGCEPGFQTDIQRELWEVMRNIFGEGGNRLIASEKLIKVYLLWPIWYRLNKQKVTMKKKNMLHYKTRSEGI